MPHRLPGPFNRWIGVETSRDQTIRHLADRSASTWQARDPLRNGAHAWQRVGDGNGPADPLHAGQVVDVVADICDLPRVQVAFSGELLEGSQLVVAALNRLDVQFAATRCHHRIRLGRKYDDVKGSFFEASDAQTVAAMTPDRLVARLMHPHSIVGHDTVEIEYDERYVSHRTDALPSIALRRWSHL